MNKKNRLLAIISVSIFITVIIGFIFVYIFKNGDRRNYKDTSKWQITITYKELNIRESASTESSILGKVSQGEIYDVIDYTEDNTYYWYKISTKDGITGYVGSKKDDAYVKESGAIKKSDISIKYYHNYAVFKDDTYNLYYVGLSEFNSVYSLKTLEVFDDVSLAVNEVEKHF